MFFPKDKIKIKWLKKTLTITLDAGAILKKLQAKQRTNKLHHGNINPIPLTKIKKITSTAKLPSDASAPARKDIDEEITNAKLRASTGAKSLLSVQSEFDYLGGSVNSPLSSVRPKLTPGTIGNDDPKLTGKISGKYRMTDHDNINLGVGVGWTKPTYQGQHGQVENPYLGYTRLFKTGPVQNVITGMAYYFTADKNVNVQKLRSETDVDWNFLYTVGHSKLQLGVDVAYSHEFYSQDLPGAGEDTVGVDPYAEYALSDRYTLRTVYNGGNYFNTVNDLAAFTRDAQYQSLGVGISVTRDIYLYPNVQWVWADVTSDKTNVALYAYINL